MPDHSFDLIVIGGGPTGASGAAGAVFLGKPPVLVEKARRSAAQGLTPARSRARHCAKRRSCSPVGVRGGFSAWTSRFSARRPSVTSCATKSTSLPPSVAARKRGAIRRSAHRMRQGCDAGLKLFNLVVAKKCPCDFTLAVQQDSRGETPCSDSRRPTRA